MSTVVLTGGIASGKSTVAKLLADLGIRTLDTDLVATELSAPGGLAISPLREIFGAGCLASDGGMDRAAMRERVFKDPAQRKALESILHPLIRAEVARFLSDVQGERAVVAIPLYFESLGYRNRFNQVVTLDCPVETQLARLTRDRSMEHALAEKILNAQVPRQVRLQLADRVICNNQGREQLASKVESWVMSWQ